MLICIICKEIISYNGKSREYALCPSCSKDNLTEEQKEILEKRRKELKHF